MIIMLLLAMDGVAVVIKVVESGNSGKDKLGVMIFDHISINEV